MSPARLQITIPTYKRNDILAANVARLLPQMTSECRLVILDNASPTPVADTLAPLLAQHPDARVEIIRNRINVGANANIARCFEVCDADWLWITGDDDSPTDDAIAVILRNADAHPDAVYFNFSSGFFHREHVVETIGINGFVDGVDAISNVLFISSGVYRSAAVVRELTLDYDYAYSHAASMVALLKSLGADGCCYLSPEQIVQWNPPVAEQQWSFLQFGLGVMTPLELPMDAAHRRTLARKILAAIPQKHENFLVQLLLMALRTGDARGAIYRYDQLCYRLYYFDRSLIRRVKVVAYRWLLRFPRVGYTLLSTSYTLLKRKSLTSQLLTQRHWNT
jgi:glycosyltransferase involved in cell wall biosynthesis